MKDTESSPWDKPRPPTGPRLAGGEPTHSTESRPSIAPRPDLPKPSSTRQATITTSSRGPRLNKRLLAIGAAVAAAIVVIGGLVATLKPAPALDLQDAALSVVLVSAPGCGWQGSGSLVSNSGLILTNSHVATDEGADICNLEVSFTDNYDQVPDESYRAEVIVDEVGIDLAVLQLLDDSGSPTSAPNRAPIPLDTSTPDPGDEIQTLGYPGAGGATLTFTSGDFSGIDSDPAGEFYKTTASMNPGVSGGAAFNGSFALIGVPSAGSRVDVNCDGDDCAAFGNSLGFIRPIRYAEPLIKEAKEIMETRTG